ncbi:MAG: ArgE/DapE family deacylase [Anaerolineales bacterium]
MDAHLIGKIMDSVDEGFDGELDLLAELVKIPSIRGQEAPAQDFMARLFQDRGYAVDHWNINLEDIEHMPGFSPLDFPFEHAWGVVGAHRPQNPRGKSLILNGHIDVVPTGPLDMWTTPPFQPRIEGDWMYGRGAGDMKAGLAINVYALDALARLGYKPAADVYLQSVIEEESTGDGALACVQRGYRADAVLITEPAGDMLASANVGVIWLQIEVRGRPAHAARSAEGFNAIEACYPIMDALRVLKERWNADKHPAYTEVDHPINFVISKIQGGDWTSSVPSWCRFDVRLGIYPDKAVEGCQQEIEEAIMNAVKVYPFLAENPPRLTYHGFRTPGYVFPRGTQFELSLRKAHETVFQESLDSFPSTALTDARIFGLFHDQPVLVYGPIAENIHAFDERVSIGSIRRITKSVALFIAEWCGLE